MNVRHPSLGDVIQALIDSGIQVCILTKLPNGIDVHIGDEARGAVAKKTIKPDEFGTLPRWLIKAARNHYPLAPFCKIEWMDS